MRPMIERLTPKDRRAWLRARQQDVTASVVGALFGVHPYITEAEVWGLKTGALREDPTEAPAMKRGRLLEPVAVQLIREQHPDWDVTHNAANEYWRDPEARIGATPDTIVRCPARGLGTVQIKSVEQSAFRRNWLDSEGNPEPPLWIQLQATLEAHMLGAQWAAVAPLVVGHGIECPLLGVDLMPEVVGAIRDRVAAFWVKVETGDMPLDYDRDGGLIDRLHAIGDPGDEIDLSSDNRIPFLLSEVADSQAALAASRRRKDAAEAEIKARMGSAVVAHLGRGRRITWKTRKRPAIQTPASSYRVLTLPPPDN